MASLRDREDRFRSVIRALGYRWNHASFQWFKQITQFTGTSDDRLIELTATLLSSGYGVEFPRPDLVDRVAAADYAPEYHCWIKKRLDTGWFMITWPCTKDYYARAMRLSGSRYDGGGVVIVPPESYNEILDFADLYDFRLSSGARAIADEARQRFESMVLVVPAKRVPIAVTPVPVPTIHPELLDDVDDDNDAA